MNTLVLTSLLFFIALFINGALCGIGLEGLLKHHAVYPPRGWNSYDSFSWTISEEEFLQSAAILKKRLHAHGYEYVVVDYLWYRKKVDGAYTDSLGFDVIDEWGRVMPDPDRWPSSRGGKGFSDVAKKVHSLGLKFGIHVMKGISTQAVNANSPILDIVKGVAYEESGKHWGAKDIGFANRACAWMPHGFMSLNTSSGAGKAFLRSLYEQYASWGVDFVKHDCVFGDDLDIDEIKVVSKIIRELDHPILYSLSPGTNVTPAIAKQVSGLVNMYRITGDDWDSWSDVAGHFNIIRDFSYSKMIGATGLLGKSWPDLDMLPFGWLTDAGSNLGPHRMSKLTLNEQKTQMTLCAMAKSPLMFGGDLRRLDKVTFNIIANPTILEINLLSTGNREFPYISQSKLLRSKNCDHSINSGSQINISTMETHVFGIASCKLYKTRGWIVEVLDQNIEQVCLKDGENGEPHCLYRKKLPPVLFEDQHHQGELHLLADDSTEFCLDASRGQKLASKESKSGSFSPCRHDLTQMWGLKHGGILVNNHSGLCASVNVIRDNVPTGIRAWIAHGGGGKNYISFFNLKEERVVIFSKISDLAKVVEGGGNLNEGSCNCTEVWSGKHIGIRKGILSMIVEGHGCALFVLVC